MKNTVLLTLAVACLIGAGCSSIQSTHVKRNEEMCGWETTHLHGIPVTLQVPHHFRVEVIETSWEKNGNLVRDAATKVPVTTHDVNVAVADTQEIFTVDFVKPGAGTLNTHVWGTRTPSRRFTTSCAHT
jgi:hypothetical protein